MRFSSPHTRAFSLIEMSVVLALIGIVAGYMLMVTDSSKNTNCYAETKAQIGRVQEAIERYAMSKDKFPMPARRQVGVESDQYGREVELADIGDLDEKANTDGDVAVFGAVPFQALGISVENAVDCWGNKLTYVVTKNLTDPAKFLVAETNGAMDVNSNSGVLHLKGAGYAIISHGADELGAVKNNYQGTDRKWCSASSGAFNPLRVENCDVDNTILMAAQFNDGKDGANKFFDDVITYRGKPWRKGTGNAGGKVYCWGNVNPHGTGTVNRPTLMSTTLDFVTISTGGKHACALTAAGKAYCWGSNYHGQLGNAAVGSGNMWIESATPVAVDGAFTFSAISAGYEHTCALNKADGKAYCWGWGTHGQLGIGTNSDILNYPTAVLGPDGAAATALSFASITAGYQSSCGLMADGKAYCWGNQGLLGNYSGPPEAYNYPILYHALPTPVYGPAGNVATSGGNWGELSQALNFTSIAHKAADRACALSPAGFSYCWGNGTNIGLGRGDGNGASMPLPTFGPTPSPFGSLASAFRYYSLSVGGGSASAGTTCGIALDGKTYCWGDDTQGQIGRGMNGTYARLPFQLYGLAGNHSTWLNFVAIDVGGSTACGLEADGKAYCWGRSDGGRLGNGTNGTSIGSIVKPVAGPAAAPATPLNFASISSGFSGTCAIVGTPPALPSLPLNGGWSDWSMCDASGTQSRICVTAPCAAGASSRSCTPPLVTPPASYSWIKDGSDGSTCGGGGTYCTGGGNGIQFKTCEKSGANGWWVHGYDIFRGAIGGC